MIPMLWVNSAAGEIDLTAIFPSRLCDVFFTAPIVASRGPIVRSHSCLHIDLWADASTDLWKGIRHL